MTKILVIEDEEILRDNIIKWLSFEGYYALGAADGLEGVNQAFVHQPDLIVCDINMPGLDGYEVLLEIRANTATQLTPFIFLTAKTMPEDMRMGMSLGADDYITKPFERLDLLQAIRTRLDKRATQESIYQQKLDAIEDMLAQEREDRLLQTKLVAMFSHDFRTPLTAIATSNNLLQEFADKMDRSRRLIHTERIEASVQQLTQMLDSMLLVAQMETGKFNLDLTAVNLGQFLESIIIEFRRIHGKSYQIHFENHFNKTIEADTRLLRQIADNLISNAIKYSPPTSDVHIKLENGGQYCQFTVKDNGRGIPKQDLPTLFNEFQRGSNVGKVRGTGLGLAIVKQAVNEHHGSIVVESEVGRGTTFIVQLPLERTTAG